jgi:hypothetical protein
MQPRDGEKIETMKKIFYLIIFFTIQVFSQNSKNDNSAAEIVNSSILEIEQGIITGNGYEIHLPTFIAQLSGIKPKDEDLGYCGHTYSPTIEEVKLWKNWFEKNKTKISFGEIDKVSGEKIIQFEYETGKFR